MPAKVRIPAAKQRAAKLEKDAKEAAKVPKLDDSQAAKLEKDAKEAVKVPKLDDSQVTIEESLELIDDDTKHQGIRDTMREMTKAFTGKREVSVQEAVYRVLSLPLFYKSKKVQY